MKLTVLLGASGEASFDISLNDNDFVYKWVKELEWSINHCDFNQQETFLQFYSIELVEQILYNACSTINKYLKNYIDIRSDISKQPQEYFNYLHSIFDS